MKADAATVLAADTDGARQNINATPITGLAVHRFPDGSMGLFTGYQAVHLNPTQAETLIGILRGLGEIPPRKDSLPQVGVNAIQIGGNHYRDASVQVWDAVVAWGCGFLDGNVVKYVARYRKKGGLEDLQKARHYLEKLIETETCGKAVP